MSILSFLILTFGISLTGFLFIVFLPGAQSFDTATGFPFWLVTIWGPTLAALVLSHRRGALGSLLERAVRIDTVPWEVWLLILAPIGALALLLPFAPDTRTPLTPLMLLAMIAFNLFLGPLGEELGWRGVLQDQLNLKLGWLEASVVVGVIWLAWHLPLWLIDSPHSQISLPLFAIHCMLYAVIIGAAYRLSGGSILPAIALHLTFNVASNLAIFGGFRDPSAWFAASIGPYAAMALLAGGLVYLKTGQSGLAWTAAVLR